MTFADDIKAMRSKLMEHLEAALALARETGFIIEQALDQLRGSMRPGNLELLAVIGCRPDVKRILRPCRDDPRRPDKEPGMML